MTKQHPNDDALTNEDAQHDSREHYEAPVVQSVKLTDEAAESLT